MNSRGAFLMWLGIVYLNRTPPPQFRDGVPAEDDPLLVLQFHHEYEAGSWRQLGRGLTLEEGALMLEFSFGERFMTLINAAGPQLPTSRIKRKLTLSAGAILELATMYFRNKTGKTRHGLQTLYYDEQGQTGHCIALQDANYQEQRFAYFDPWPGRSLLCEENNKAGIKAQSLGTSRLHFHDRSVDYEAWEIGRNELAQVLVAMSVPLTDWSELVFGMLNKNFPPQLRDELTKAMAAQADSQQ